MASRTAVKGTARHPNGNDIDSKSLLRVLKAVQLGDFTARMPVDGEGSAARIAIALNSIIESNQRLESEIRRLSRQVGKEGDRKESAIGHGGAWQTTIDAVSDLVEVLARPN